MRVHFIDDNGILAAFFPDTFKFFEINHFTKKIIDSFVNNETKESIMGKYNLDKEQYKSIESQLLGLSDNKVEDCSNKMKGLFKLVINITNKCNLKCKYCYANGGSYCSEEGIMKEENIEMILDKIYKEFKTIRIIQLFGGEPTLNLKAIRRAGEYITQKFQNGDITVKPQIGMITNGTNVNKEFIDLIKKYDINVTVSLDGPPKVNDSMRVYRNGKGTSNRIVNNIKLLRKETNQPNHIEATYNTNHINNNVSVMDVINYINDDLNINNVHLVPASGDENCSFVLKDRDAFINSVSEVFQGINDGSNRSYSLVNRVVTALTKRKTTKYFCDAGITSLSVAINGDVYPCFMLIDQDQFKMGNIFDEHVFESEKYNNEKTKLKDFSKFTHEKCKDCFNNTLCSGCLGVNYFECGDVHISSEMNCEMYRKITEKTIIEIIKNKKQKSRNIS